MADQILSPAANSSVVIPPNNDIAYLSPDLTVLIKGGVSGVTYDSSTSPQTFTWSLLYDHATPVGGAVTPTANGFTINAGTATFSLSDAENPAVPLAFLALDVAGPPVTITQTPSPNGMAMGGLKLSFTDPQAAVGTVGFTSSNATGAMPDLFAHIG